LIKNSLISSKKAEELQNSEDDSGNPQNNQKSSAKSLDESRAESTADDNLTGLEDISNDAIISETEDSALISNEKLDRKSCGKSIEIDDKGITSVNQPDKTDKDVNSVLSTAINIVEKETDKEDPLS